MYDIEILKKELDNIHTKYSDLGSTPFVDQVVARCNRFIRLLSLDDVTPDELECIAVDANKLIKHINEYKS